jgi:hypothetical protein
MMSPAIFCAVFAYLEGRRHRSLSFSCAAPAVT